MLRLSFNRTIVELKCYYITNIKYTIMTFNRTIVELKSERVIAAMERGNLLIVP